MMTTPRMRSVLFCVAGLLSIIALGIGLLIVCLFAAELRILAVPGLALLLPSLIYGMR